MAEPCESTSDALDTLTKVRKVLSDKTNESLSLSEVLSAGIVTHSDYFETLKVFAKRSVAVLKREPSECNINNYDTLVVLAWQANMDLQYVLNAYACIMYVASYIMKTDRAMSELVGSAFLTHREGSARKAAYRIHSLPMSN